VTCLGIAFNEVEQDASFTCPVCVNKVPREPSPVPAAAATSLKDKRKKDRSAIATTTIMMSSATAAAATSTSTTAASSRANEKRAISAAEKAISTPVFSVFARPLQPLPHEKPFVASHYVHAPQRLVNLEDDDVSGVGNEDLDVDIGSEMMDMVMDPTRASEKIHRRSVPTVRSGQTPIPISAVGVDGSASAAILAGVAIADPTAPPPPLLPENPEDHLSVYGSDLEFGGNSEDEDDDKSPSAPYTRHLSYLRTEARHAHRKAVERRDASCAAAAAASGRRRFVEFEDEDAR